jgi:DNA invertase Pin-like site-specific DNA recombinase
VAEALKRCAVYTRKSTEDGLAQEFNSLDAQYEACAAYALSQKHEGWLLAETRYDDGGFSGGNMERPGLKALLADVAAGKVDVILVYKIDRLTRSLADFAKIVDVLDKAETSFVSITQSFNTTTSMGRLTLNMLLSFAQFEREVTGERIRDKIAASKRKGLWMGGKVALGYVVENRRLVVEETEAKLVKLIFKRYLALGSVEELADELNAKGYKTKVQRSVTKPPIGGCPFRRGTLYHMLANPIYLGKVVHKGEAFPGEHDAIISEKLWHAVQEKLKANASGLAKRIRGQQPSLLIGLIKDSLGRPMTASHASKGKTRRYRYYVTRPDKQSKQPAYRVSAHDLEKLVTDKLAKYLATPSNIAALAPPETEAITLQEALNKADIAAAILRSGTGQAKRDLLAQLLAQATLHEASVSLELSSAGLANVLALDVSATPLIHLSVPVTRARKGYQLRLVIEGAGDTPQPTPAEPKVSPEGKELLQLAQAWRARRFVLANPHLTLSEAAAQFGHCRQHFAKLVERSCVPPARLIKLLTTQHVVSCAFAFTRPSG